MGYRIQNRRDTAERWAEVNPILLEGEVGYVTDNPNQHKIGDGIHRWNDLPLRGYTGTIAQEFGNDENAVVSQKAVTEKLSELGSIYSKESFIRTISYEGTGSENFGITESGWIGSLEFGCIINKNSSDIIVRLGQESGNLFYTFTAAPNIETYFQVPEGKECRYINISWAGNSISAEYYHANSSSIKDIIDNINNKIDSVNNELIAKTDFIRSIDYTAASPQTFGLPEEGYVSGGYGCIINKNQTNITVKPLNAGNLAVITTFIAKPNEETLFYIPSDKECVALTIEYSGGSISAEYYLAKKVKEAIYDILDNSKNRIFEGKKLIAIGDSHTKNFYKWMSHLLERTGAINNSTVQNQVLNAYYKEEYPQYPSSLVAQAMKLVELKNSLTYKPDIILMENCHYFDKKGLDIDEPTIIPIAMGEYATTYASINEARTAWENNKSTIISSFDSQKSPRFLLKMKYGTLKKKIQFTATKTITDGSVKLTVDGVDFVTQITAGMTLTQAIEAMSIWNYGEYTNWNVSTQESDKLVLVYKGNQTEPTISVVFNDIDNCGLSLVGVTQEGVNDYFMQYYQGLDLSDWNDTTKWINVEIYAPAYGWLKGFYEIIQQNFPEAILITWTVGNYNLYESDYRTNGIFDYADFLKNNSNWNTFGVGAMNIFKEVSELYNVKCIDVQSLCGITPFNMFTGNYYSSNDVHPTVKGYIKWIDTLIDNL